MRSRSPADNTERRDNFTGPLSPGEILDRLTQMDQLAATIVSEAAVLGVPEVMDAARSLAESIEHSSAAAYRAARRLTIVPPLAPATRPALTEARVSIAELRSTADARVALNIISQKLSVPPPEYTSSSEGPAHAPNFRATLRFCGKTMTTSGHMRQRDAQERVAQQWLWAEYGSAARALTYMGSFNPYGNGQRVEFQDEPLMTSVCVDDMWVAHATLTLTSVGANPPSFSASAQHATRACAELEAVQKLFVTVQEAITLGEADPVLVQAGYNRSTAMGGSDPGPMYQRVDVYFFSAPGAFSDSVQLNPPTKCRVNVDICTTSVGGIGPGYFIFGGNGTIPNYFPGLQTVQGSLVVQAASSANQLKQFSFDWDSTITSGLFLDVDLTLGGAGFITVRYDDLGPNVNICGVGAIECPPNVMNVQPAGNFPIDIVRVNGGALSSPTVPIDIARIHGNFAASLDVNVKQVAGTNVTSSRVPVDIKATGGVVMTDEYVPVTGGGGTAADVRVVHIDPLITPLWTSQYQQRSAPISRPPPVRDSTPKVSEEEASKHNAEMHATHGNGSLADIEGMGLEQFVESFVSGNVQHTLDSAPFSNPDVKSYVKYVLSGDMPPSTTSWDPTDVPAKPIKDERGRESAPAKAKATGPQHASTAKSGTTAVRNLKAVVKRVVAKMQKADRRAIIDYGFACEDKEFYGWICDNLWGKGWDPAESAEKWFAAWRIGRLEFTHEHATALELFGYTWFDAKFAAAVKTDYADAFAVFSLGRDVSDEASVAASLHKKKNFDRASAMGGTDPGPKFSATMNDIRAAPGFELCDTPTAGKTDIAALMATLASMPSSTNPRDASIAQQMPIRGDNIFFDNSVQLARTMRPMSSNVLARQIRAPGGTLGNSPVQEYDIRVAIMNSLGRPLTNTDLFTGLMNTSIATNNSLGRADMVTTGGFLLAEVNWVARLKSVLGLNMDTYVARILLLHNVLAWIAPTPTLPLSAALQISDPSTKPVEGRPDLELNTSPIMGEDLGGNDPIWPFGPDDPLSKGGLHFSTCLAAVPQESRANAVFLPASIFTGAENAQKQIALFIMGLTTAPFAQYILKFATLDSNRGNLDSQRFASTSSMINIPGMEDLWIILPRNGPAKNPQSADDADQQVLLKPTFGPTATANYNADQVIPLNGINTNPKTRVYMTDYCYSWLGALTTQDIQVHLQRMNELMDLNDTISSVNEKLCGWGINIYQPLVVNPINAQSRLAAQNWGTATGVELTRSGDDWPRATGVKGDFLMGALDITALNRVLLGLAVAEGMGPTVEPLPKILSVLYPGYWNQLIGLQQAVTINVLRHLLGFDTQCWREAFLNNNLPFVRSLIRGFYVSGTAGATPLGCLNRAMVIGLHTGIHGTSPVADINGLTVYDYICPNRDSDFLTPIRRLALARMYGIVPIFLPDVVIHSVARNLPLSAMSFPPPNNSNSTTGICESDFAMVAIPAGILGPMLKRSTPKNSLPLYATRDDSMAERFNARLVSVVVPTSRIRNYGGNIVANIPDANEFVMANPALADFTTPNHATGIHVSSTLWVPTIDSGGAYLFPSAIQAEMAHVAAVMAGSARASIGCWLIGDVVGFGAIETGPDTVNSMWAKYMRSAQKNGTANLRDGAPPGGETALAAAQAAGAQK